MKIIRRKREANKSDTYQGSISDLMSSLVFVFIVAIVMFVIKFSDVIEKKNKALTEYKENIEARNSLLKELEKSLKKIGVNVTIDYENGILRLPEEALFESGEWNFKNYGRAVVKKLSSNIKTLLNCKTTKIKELCDENNKLKIEAIFIEGHSDSIKLGPRLRREIESNLNLSAQRAINTYKLMEGDVGVLKNRENKYLFSVAGYGSRRPAGKKPNGKLSRRKRNDYHKMNRRIDLRFLMSIPKFLMIK